MKAVHLCLLIGLHFCAVLRADPAEKPGFLASESKSEHAGDGKVKPPYPPSPVISSLKWDDVVFRLKTRAGDNWPITWAEGDLQLTAWGDGPGFDEQPPRLSLGFARILGDPPNLRAEDFPTDADTVEGGGSSAIKASGLLLVDGTLYMWVRNYRPPGSDDFTNARLAWSKNHGTNWTWADWHFAGTFGCPEFVQFGPNYAGARDDYVYVVSQANDSAYGYSLDIVMARVPRKHVSERDRFEFFTGLDRNGQPQWSSDLSQRQPIFTDTNSTQRIAITYNSGLKRYLLTTSHRPAGSQATHTSALGVFDAPEPWGPWTTVYYDSHWSGTNRTYHHKFPTKWMSPDGRTAWLLYSGLDGGLYTFCLRKAVLETRTPSLAKDRLDAIAARLPTQPTGLGRPISDRAAWDKLAHMAGFERVASSAQSLAREPAPALPDDLYLDYSRTGNRDRCQAVMSQRSQRIVTFTLAECLENQGRFLGPLSDTIEAICQERTWVYPAHDGKLDNFYGRTVEMDLRATVLGWELATAGCLLGEQLSPETRRLLRDNVERRVLQPFLDMMEGRRKEISWLRVENNWNAVCLSGVTGAALALEESPQERARFVAAAEKYIPFFLRSFTPDGYCAEGMGYWNYGFGHFLMLSETVRQASGGAVDLLADPAARQPALFSARAEVLAGIYPTISDCHPGSRPGADWVRFIRARFGEEKASAAEWAGPRDSLVTTLLFSFLPTALPVVPNAAMETNSPLRTWFKDGGVLICRPVSGLAGTFAAVLKGGHNAEPHNHNDLGSFSVIAGKTMVLCDPGAEIYTRRTFGEHRYDSKVLNSYGHAVPVIAGQLQRPGAEAKAVVLRSDFSDSEDTLALDIRSAYAVPELKRLERTFVFRRGAPESLTVRDEVVLSEPKSFETALVTWGDWKRVSEMELLVADEGGAVRVAIDTGGKPFHVRWEQLDEDVPTPKKPMRLGIALDTPVKAVTVTLTIRPETEPNTAQGTVPNAK